MMASWPNWVPQPERIKRVQPPKPSERQLRHLVAAGLRMQAMGELRLSAQDADRYVCEALNAIAALGADSTPKHARRLRRYALNTFLHRGSIEEALTAPCRMAAHDLSGVV